MNIVPMRDLKNTTKIENMCNETLEPVFVTKNGYGKLVVMNIDYFEKIMIDSYYAKEINKGLDDFKNGRVKNSKDVFESIKKQI